MRELKFRVWDGKRLYYTEELWGALSDFGFGYIGANIIDDEKPWEFNDKEIKIQQFTGLKDKNGREIYEGDIVKQIGDYGIEYNTEVTFGEGRFNPLVKVEFGYNTIDNYEAERFEIIGNIMENPDILAENDKK